MSRTSIVTLYISNIEQLKSVAFLLTRTVVLFKVPNTGAFTVLQISGEICKIIILQVAAKEKCQEAGHIEKNTLSFILSERTKYKVKVKIIFHKQQIQKRNIKKEVKQKKKTYQY